jgi:putative FmdB family regulatory protein
VAEGEVRVLPLYEYRCTKCGAQFERIQKFSDAPLTRCEKCSGKLERLLSSPAIRFKGSGWYVTDYARKSSAPASEGKSTTTSASDKGKESAPKPAESTSSPASKKDS